MQAIAQEIHYLSKLTNLPCHSFKHILVTANILDPIETAEVGACASAPLREAHLFTFDGSPQQKEFERAVHPLGVRRKWDCVPHPGQPPNICYTVPRAISEDFERLASGVGLAMEWGIVVAPKTLMTFDTPENFTWIVTYIYLRTLPTVVAGGDFRSDDFDENGLTNAWIEINDVPVLASNQVVTFGLFNKPVLFAFAGGRQVEFIVQRDAASVPAAFQVHLAASGYLAPPQAYDALVSNLTDIFQPGSGGY